MSHLDDHKFDPEAAADAYQRAEAAGLVRISKPRGAIRGPVIRESSRPAPQSAARSSAHSTSAARSPAEELAKIRLTYPTGSLGKHASLLSVATHLSRADAENFIRQQTR
jgi:hypothetical protein